MPVTKMTDLTLPAEQVSAIEGLIAQGRFTSPSEVIEAGLQALRDRDIEVERWLEEQAAPVFDAMIAEPGRAIAAHEVFAAVRAVHREHLNGLNDA